MTSTHPNHRNRSRRPLASLWAAIVLAVAGATGCASALPADPAQTAHSALAPVAPPSPPMLLAELEPRSLGPLQQVSEEQITLVTKAVPAGTITLEKLTIDTDSMVRATGAGHTVDGRITEHQGRTRRTQLVGVSPQGFVRFQVEYLQDGSMSVEDGMRMASASPAQGKRYVLDVDPSGMRVLTPEGYTPPAQEVSVVLEDFAHLRRRRDREPGAAFGPEGPARRPTPSEMVTASVRRSLQDSGMTTDEVRAQLKGVRDVSGTSCAVFDLSVRARKQQAGPGRTMSLEMTLSGEYALRLADGWEAEMLLTGTTRAVGQLQQPGAVVSVNTAGHTRIYMHHTYAVPDGAKARPLEPFRPAAHHTASL